MDDTRDPLQVTLTKEEQKQAFKDAIKEMMRDQMADVGREAIGVVWKTAFLAFAYLWWKTNGWSK